MVSEISIATMLVGQLRGFLAGSVQRSVARYAANSSLFVLLKLATSERTQSAAVVEAAWRLGARRW